MFAALAYKEWLKLRMVFWVPLLGALLASGSVWATMRHVNEIIGPGMLWYDALLADKIFYADFKSVPALSALWFALFQFVPECSARRLRLLFHLPVPRRRAIYFMVVVGLACTAATCFLGLVAIGLIIRHYMPIEAVCTAFLTCGPWWLSAFTTYLGAVLVLMEPSWSHKLVYGLCTAVFALVLTSTAMQGAYLHSLPWYALACLLWVLPVELAAGRFKRGVA